MALQSCRECKLEVSSAAPVCPHCGIAWPVVQGGRKPGQAPLKGGDVAKGVIVLAIVFGLVAWWNASPDLAPKPSDVTSARAVPVAAVQPDLGGILEICAAHVDPDDWADEFDPARGQVAVPTRTVFVYGGHLLGTIQDPTDQANDLSHKLSKIEEQRQGALMKQDMADKAADQIAVATTEPVTLTPSSPCAQARAVAVTSKQWKWSATTVMGDPTVYYQAYGIVTRGYLDTQPSDDTIPVVHLMTRGQLNATAVGTIGGVVDLDQWSASLPPDEMPVTGKGNSECWGDDKRQDISCRSLTEHFLMSLRNADKRTVQKMMNVKGRDVGGGLHFISNYSRGERWGSGDINVSFDHQGKVYIIYALLDRPNADGPSADLMWNKQSMPDGCSDLPGSFLKACNN